MEFVIEKITVDGIVRGGKNFWRLKGCGNVAV